MIDVGFWEVAMIGVMALIILGPERLPGVARTAGLWIGKARSIVREIKADIQSEIDSADMSELKDVGKNIREAGDAFKSQVADAEVNFKSEASEMDTAIADALSKPVPGSAAKSSDDAASGFTDKSEVLDKFVKNKTSKTKPPQEKVSNKATKKKTSKKKASKKKPAASTGKAQKPKRKAAEKASEKTSKSPKSSKK